MKYFDLNRPAMLAVKPGGMLVTCSCSGMFSPEDFFTVLRGAARGARKRVQVLRQTGPGAGSSRDDRLSRSRRTLSNASGAKVW